MAIRFSKTPAHSYLRVNSVPTISSTWAFSLWFKADNVTGPHTLLRVEFDDPETENNRFMIWARGDLDGDPVRFTSHRAGEEYYAATTGAFTANTWHHVLAHTETASTDILRISLDGAAWDESLAAKMPFGSPSYIQVGGDNAFIPAIDGSIAEVAIWDAPYASQWISAGIADRLTKGFSPLKVNPGNRPLAYWRLLGEGAYQDIVGGRTLTAYNSPVGASDHPPMRG